MRISIKLEFFSIVDFKIFSFLFLPINFKTMFYLLNNKPILTPDMQGAFPNDNEELATMYDSLKTTIQGAEDIRVFLDTSKMSMPSSIEEAKSRLAPNLEKFKGNYLFLAAVIMVIFLIYKILVLPLFLLWGVYCYLVKGATEISIADRTIKKEWLLRVCIGISVLYLMVFNSIVMTLMVLLSIFFILSIGHGVLYKNGSVDEELI
ncbi:hypothetical protein TCON_0487 [Astathelohania contejeani]|uniref:PRA1 family protein n=1 Tax=Astathelohania contejeani TaxID=164912 RepID=A0ABQ7I1T1_9MICR|nr:hypothetical protein TCON_0487 [Thelohania contejeani]